MLVGDMSQSPPNQFATNEVRRDQLNNDSTKIDRGATDSIVITKKGCTLELRRLFNGGAFGRDYVYYLCSFIMKYDIA